MRTLRELMPPSHVYRPVDQNGLDFCLLKDSIEKNGLLVPLTICDGKIVDGYRRWLVCKGLGWVEIDCHEVTGDPDTLRIIAQTRLTEFNRHDKRAFVGQYLNKNRDAESGAMAHEFQWSPIEVESLAGVPYLIPELVRAYERGELRLSDVWHVSKVRDQGQMDLYEVGVEEIFERAKEMHREERSARRRSMVSRPRAKGYPALVSERDKPQEAGLCLLKANAQTPMDGWRACLEWVLGKDSK